jgi:hypothetical protein
MAGDSRESPTRTCKKTAAERRNSGKSAHWDSSNHTCPSALRDIARHDDNSEDKGMANKAGLSGPKAARS